MSVHLSGNHLKVEDFSDEPGPDNVKNHPELVEGEEEIPLDHPEPKRAPAPTPFSTSSFENTKESQAPSITVPLPTPIRLEPRISDEQRLLHELDSKDSPRVGVAAAQLEGRQPNVFVRAWRSLTGLRDLQEQQLVKSAIEHKAELLEPRLKLLSNKNFAQYINKLFGSDGPKETSQAHRLAIDNEFNRRQSRLKDLLGVGPIAKDYQDMNKAYNDSLPKNRRDDSALFIPPDQPE